jgi:hypothetical protein
LKFNVYNDLGDQIGSKTVKLNVVASSNNAPVITTTQESYTINKNDIFAFNDIVTITDVEDGNIVFNSSQHIDYYDFNPSAVGIYTVIYSYTDTGGLTTYKSIGMNVIEPEPIPPEPVGDLSISFTAVQTRLNLGQFETAEGTPVFELPAFEVKDTRETTGSWRVQVTLETFFNENSDPIDGLVKTYQREGESVGFGHNVENEIGLDNSIVLYRDFISGDTIKDKTIVQMESGIAKGTYLFGGFEAMLDFNSVDPSLLKPGKYQSTYSIKILDGP